jgi:hypothetical protein
MPKRRVLRGKKLLVAAGIAGASFGGLSCVSNPVPPPPQDSGARDAGVMDASAPIDASEPMDAMTFPFDGPVANLVAPPEDAGDENDAGEPSDAEVIGFPDAPVANLLPPPPEE